MLKSKLLYAFVLSFCVICIACSNSDDEGNTKVEVDLQPPVLECLEDISVNIAAIEGTAVVTFNAPEGTDNVSAVTTQIAGLASGENFPVGTTINTFKATDSSGNSTTCSFNVTVVKDVLPGSTPYFVEANPAPSGKKWVKVEALSDEFDDNNFDTSKWLNTDPQRWIGRAPGIFKTNTVRETEGNLSLTAYKLDASEVVNGKTFTHAGSYIASKTAAQVGYYFETKMKANKTFMSSTFWLINNRNDGTGCDRRVTELDIQECVGQITTTANWAQEFDSAIHSNTHSRQADCVETPTGSVGGNKELGGKAWADYHIYAAWWKSTTEIEFYLDGKKVYTATPKANFDLPMYLRMVVETYDWNPVPVDGGMTGTEFERTTYYDWVRSWELKDE